MCDFDFSRLDSQAYVLYVIVFKVIMFIFESHKMPLDSKWNHTISIFSIGLYIG